MPRPTDDRHDTDRGAPRAHLSADLAGAYVDGELSPAERRSAEAHLATCGRCRAEIAELRGLVAALAALPEPRPRRSFQLSPEQARRPLSPWTRLSRRLIPAVPAIRAVTVAVVLLLAAAVLREVLTDDGRDRVALDGPQAAMAPTATAPTAGGNGAALQTNQAPVSAPTVLPTIPPTVRPIQPTTGALAAATQPAAANAAPAAGRSDAVAGEAPDDTAATGSGGAAESGPVAAALGDAPTSDAQAASDAAAKSAPAPAGAPSSAAAAPGPTVAAEEGAAINAAEAPDVTGAVAPDADIAEPTPVQPSLAFAAAEIAAPATPAASPVASPAASPVASPVAGRDGGRVDAGSGHAGWLPLAALVTLALAVALLLIAPRRSAP